MKLRSIHPKRHRRAMTMLEFFVVVVVLAVLVAMAFPKLFRRPGPAQRDKCVNNLKNVGLAFRIFATDNADRFPMDVPSTNGGSLEFVEQPTQIWRHYLALSNGLSTPKILLCPNDSDAREANAFGTMTNEPNQIPFTSNSNISYFVGLDVRETDAYGVLSGDRNLTNDTPLLRYGVAAVRGLGTNHTRVRGAGWDHHIHAQQGNVLLGDGSVQQVNTLRLRQLLRESGDANNRIAKP